MGIIYYNKDAAVTWETASTNSERTSVFDGFKPYSTAGTSIKPIVQKQHLSTVLPKGNYKLFDIQGRLLDTFTAKTAVNITKIASNIGKGVYFLVNEKTLQVKRLPFFK
jgi:hypothetical protein